MASLLATREKTGIAIGRVVSAGNGVAIDSVAGHSHPSRLSRAAAAVANPGRHSMIAGGCAAPQERQATATSTRDITQTGRCAHSLNLARRS